MTFRVTATESFHDRQYFYESSPGRVAAKSDLRKCKAGQRRGILRVGGFGCRTGQTGNRINQRDDAIVGMTGLSAQVDECKLNAVITRLGGGIGRHTRLKICCPKGVPVRLRLEASHTQAISRTTDLAPGTIVSRG